MSETKFSFEKLAVWQEVRKLVAECYSLVCKFPKEEKYALGNQIRRAVVSIASNIAEGSGRVSLKEKMHFIEIAYGSLMEVYCQLQIACDLKFINKTDLKSMRTRFSLVSIMLTALRSAFQKRLPH